MKGRHGFSRIVVLSICVILLLSLVEVPEREPSRLHLDSEMISAHLDDGGQYIATMAMLSCPTSRCSGPENAGSSSLAPDEAGPGSSIVLRV